MHLNDGRVVSNFIVQALQNKPITIYGDGSQTRSFCHVTDLIDGLVALMGSANGFTGPINLGNPDECTIAELAEKVRLKTNSRSQVVLAEQPQDDPMQLRPNIGLAEEELGWTPKVSLDEGLDSTIEYFDQYLAGHVRDT